LWRILNGKLQVSRRGICVKRYKVDSDFIIFQGARYGISSANLIARGRYAEAECRLLRADLTACDVIGGLVTIDINWNAIWET
jgi:hypothetical protein